jgi:aryl-alcohol dehydrogenase-like predicted oxidoreductase/predicted kinase
MAWLDPSELRIGLGCMRLEPDAFEEVVAAAAAAGIVVFDTARAYEGNERLLATALRACGAESRARIVTKGGMARPGGAWVPDGRAKSIRADCEASRDALDGLPVDLYVLHTPDPRTPWATSVRALARLVDEGLVRRLGVSNVNRRQLDEALELAPVAGVQVALSRLDDRALRGGVVERCDELGIALLAHSPLGGPKRAGRLDAQEALVWLLGLSPVVVPIPGARRPETARASAAAAAAAPAARRGRRPRPTPRLDADVVLVMGVPGSGKSRVAGDYVARGYVRLNRDERGGSLRDLARALEEALREGTRELVLDNTYLTRASRNDVVEAASRRGAAVRCVWLDTPLAQAQGNMVERLLDRFDRLPSPEELREASRREPWLLAPTSLMRAARELEPPAADEGFSSVERVPFIRAERGGVPGVFVAAAALGERDELVTELPEAPHLVFDWGDGDLRPLAARVRAPVVETGACSHGGGPPVCWCRPPLPGLPLAFARRRGVDPARSLLVGTSAAHRTLAAALGARFVAGVPE